jgi:hypothetical protein
MSESTTEVVVKSAVKMIGLCTKNSSSSFSRAMEKSGLIWQLIVIPASQTTPHEVRADDCSAGLESTLYCLLNDSCFQAWNHVFLHESTCRSVAGISCKNHVYLLQSHFINDWQKNKQWYDKYIRELVLHLLESKVVSFYWSDPIINFEWNLHLTA